MINRTYLGQLLRDHLILIIFAFALCGLLQFLLLTLISTIDIKSIAESFFTQLPEPARKMFRPDFLAQLTVRGTAAFGYQHPMVLIFLSLLAIQVPARHIAGEVESGTLELLFTLPQRRLTYGITLWLFSIVALLFVITGCLLGSGLGMAFNPETADLPLNHLLKIGLNLWLMMMVINAAALLCSAYLREGGKAALIAGGITLFFYFLDYILQLATGFDILKYFTIFNYYKPLAVMAGTESVLPSLLILGLMLILLLTAAFHRLNNRDVPG